MIVQTTRFGRIEVDETRLLRFPKGILGFPDIRDYALVQTNDEGNFFWLQAVARPDIAFVVCDPLLFVPDYQIPVKSDDLKMIGLDDMTNAQVLIIVNKVERLLTGNLQGPLVVNAENLQAVQLVLSEKKYSTRHPLMELETPAICRASKTA